MHPPLHFSQCIINTRMSTHTCMHAGTSLPSQFIQLLLTFLPSPLCVSNSSLHASHIHHTSAHVITRSKAWTNMTNGETAAAHTYTTSQLIAEAKITGAAWVKTLFDLMFKYVSWVRLDLIVHLKQRGKHVGCTGIGATKDARALWQDLQRSCHVVRHAVCFEPASVRQKSDAIQVYFEHCDIFVEWIDCTSQ